MFRPEPMTRCMIWGALNRMEGAVDALYDCGCAHLVTPPIESDAFRNGGPGLGAAEAAARLTLIRSVKNAMRITERRSTINVGDRVMSLAFANQILGGLEKKVQAMDASIRDLERRINDDQKRVDEISEIASLGISLSVFVDYQRIAWFVGNSPASLKPALSEIAGDRFELFEKQYANRRIVAVFVVKELAADVQVALNRSGFTAIPAPGPNETVETVSEQLQNNQKELKTLLEIRSELVAIYLSDILDAEYVLNEIINRSSCPYHFTVSDRAFVADFWAPTARLKHIEERLKVRCVDGVTIDIIETPADSKAHSSIETHHDETPPTLLKNPKFARPFESLTRLFGVMSYNELDPTIILALTFPLFFGFMIGDVGYGLIIAGIGAYLARKKPALRDLGIITLVCGAAGAVFGAFMFADAFGIPFHSHGSGPSWSGWLGTRLLPHAIYEKLNPDHMWELMALSVLAGWVQLSLGLVFGFINEFRHHLRHALAKLGWLIVLFGCFLLALGFEAIHGTAVVRFLEATLFSPFLNHELFSAEASIIVGAPLVIAAEGISGAVELPGMLSNMLSFLRLAAICVAKGATADAFNQMVSPFFDQGISGVFIGIIAIFVAHILLLILGILSGGIQTLRLNFFEFFTKFVKAEGVAYAPFQAGSAKENAA
mgnify:CR=1 FL=1